MIIQQKKIMTVQQLAVFNKKIDILYDHERGLSNYELAARYHMTERMIRIHIKLGKNNYKIMNAVKLKTEC